MDFMIWTPLNSSGWNPKLEVDKKWMDSRIELMNNWTIPSIRNQSDKNYIWSIEVREDTIDYMTKNLNLKHVNAVITPRKPKIKRKDAWIRSPETINRLIKTDNYYEARLNSDDMLHHDYIKRIRSVKCNEDTEVIIPTKGYYYYVNEEIITEKSHSSPPFHALIYNKHAYLNGFRYTLKDGHMGAKLLKCIFLHDRLWCWLIHDSNQKKLRKGKNAYPDWSRYKRVSIDKLKEFGVKI